MRGFARETRKGSSPALSVAFMNMLKATEAYDFGAEVVKVFFGLRICAEGYRCLWHLSFLLVLLYLYCNDDVSTSQDVLFT